MIVQLPRGLGECPNVKIMAHVWTELEGTGVTVLQASLENVARETSTNVFPTPATPQTAWTAYSCPMITNVCANLALQDEGVKVDSACASLSPVKMEEYVPCLATPHQDTLALVSLGTQVLTVRGA